MPFRSWQWGVQVVATGSTGSRKVTYGCWQRVVMVLSMVTCRVSREKMRLSKAHMDGSARLKLILKSSFIWPAWEVGGLCDLWLVALMD